MIDPSYIAELNEPSSNEQDLLDVVGNGQNNSRLACQVIVTEAMDGMTVSIP